MASSKIFNSSLERLTPIRGVWIPNLPHSQVLASAENITKAMDFLAESGFNLVFPGMWNQGYTLYPSEVMKNYGFPQISPIFATKNFDPLTILIEQAHQRNIAVIPWFEYGFASSPLASGGHLLQAKPHWASLDQYGRMVKHGNLIWLNSLNSEVQEFLLALILEVAQNYAVDGIQGDDRLPALPYYGGYEPETQTQYQLTTGRKPPQDKQNRQWVQWRADILTNFLANLYQQIKRINQNLIVAMSPAVYPFCLNNLMQDSYQWLKTGILDLINPQIYRSSFNQYRREVQKINKLYNQQEKQKFAPGIAFRANGVDLSIQDLLRCLKLNQDSGFRGEVFFHYEGLKQKNYSR
jgi:uncharacterized lipoprotein YddW (UPF0748 family)